MSFIEHIYLEMKAIDPGITTDRFSTTWLNKCSSYYRTNKARNRDMTLHALLCLMRNLEQKSSSLRMKNHSEFLHAKADQYEQIQKYAAAQIDELI
jgi:hypothetical protein